ncbi:CO or xanthine dehydrogenase, Mo-binding subunit [Parafrankia irregularis]|uniref:CO or xanthine dehydrogenase, Mo-binding subunit n=1 Tax=Parafrankia irregularis TaxID=795642 RepID=A0A0S4QZV8_9ACTN|nr:MULTISPECIES: xanthine dehydrogenase family protein molybdopterin-binding subunit [Parafrankia]MBE3201439.1 xanthine dehydrogenase family protein [Parafrankia sp. CH37]CUU60312.1 CO or xanthine dehydrogenase, Mo-binding subunit [Parafrankia irregularis]
MTPEADTAPRARAGGHPGMKVAGRRVDVGDARDRTIGRFPYLIDRVPAGCLHAVLVRSPHAHAHLRSVDVTAARATRGVVAVVTGEDLTRWQEQPDGPFPYYGPVLPDRPVLAIGRVRFAGEPVAAVIARDVDTAREAAATITVDYDVLPAVFTPDAAMAPDAPILHEHVPTRDVMTFPDLVLHTDDGGNVCNHFRLRRGDVDAGFAASDHILSHEFRTPQQQHVPLEPHVTIATVRGDTVDIWTSAASPFTVRSQVAETLRLPESRVRVRVLNVGGAYGAKTYPRLEPLVAVLAWAVRGRPVRVELTRAEEFATVARHSSVVRIRTGFRSDGTLLARRVEVLWGAGAYADISPRTIKNGGYSSAGPYDIPNVSIDSYAVYTNTTPSGGFRGYAIPQVAWAYENHTDLIAEHLDLDPAELRHRVLLRPGDAFATGQTIEDFHLAALLDTACDRIGWKPGPASARRVVVAPGIVRGKGVSTILKTTVTPSTSTVALKLDEDANLTVVCSTVEIGQGARTVLAQLAADATGVPLERVHVTYPDSAVTAWDQTTSSSRSTLMMGVAVERAGERLRGELARRAGALLGVPATAVDVRADRIRSGLGPGLSYAELISRAKLGGVTVSEVHASDGGLDPETGQGVVTPHFYHAAAAAEVEVDLETGTVRVVDLHVESYAGRVVHPTFAELQCEGNVAFGIGQALSEAMVWGGESGALLNDSLLDYRVPSVRDLPETFTVGMTEDPAGPDGARIHGLGETGSPAVPAAIGNAVAEALGTHIRELPLHPERVWKAAQAAAEPSAGT